MNNQIKTKQKKQFRGTSKSPTFYDRKVMRSGYGQQISVTKLIPEKWKYVRLIPVKATETKVLLEIRLLMKEANDAQTPKADKTSGKDA